MIKRLMIALTLLMAGLHWGWAQNFDFQATAPTGQTLYYKYVEGGAELVHPSSKSGYMYAWDGYDKPTGALTVPAQVSDGDTTLAVVSLGLAALAHCYNLTSVVLAEGIQQVGDYALTYCTMLASVHLPSTLLALGNQSLANLSSLTDIWSAALLPPTTHTYTFYNTDLTACTLHIDCAATASYAEAEDWANCGAVDSSSCTARMHVQSGNATRGWITGSGTYDVGTDVVIAATANAGFRFACWHDGDTINPRIVHLETDSLFIAVFLALGEGVDTVYVAVPTSDTIYVPVPVHDTLTTTDTLYVAVPTGDTIYLNTTIHDTVVMVDTLIVSLPISDTLYLVDTLELVVHDTVMPTFFHLRVKSDDEGLGLGVGTALLPAGVKAEICALPLEGGQFMGWSDGAMDNPRQITVMGNTELTAHFVALGIGSLPEPTWTLAVRQRDIIASEVAGRTLRLFDSQGRLLHTIRNAPHRTTLRVPAAGLYLLQADGEGARKIIVE